jgi:DinB family
VTRGYSEDATLPNLPDLAAIEAFREQTASATRSYLERATEAELNTPRRMISDPGQTRLLRPAHVIMRVVTHIFNHQGQVLAMCRSMGKTERHTRSGLSGRLMSRGVAFRQIAAPFHPRSKGPPRRSAGAGVGAAADATTAMAIERSVETASSFSVLHLLSKTVAQIT